jgi:hypothetical protein
MQGKLALLAAILLMTAPVASAQITAGPVGPFAMVDAEGDLIGGAIPTAGSAAIPYWAVALSTSLGRGFVSVLLIGEEGQQLLSFQEEELLFTSNNCTGQAYVRLQNAGLDGGRGLAVNNQVLYAVSPSSFSVTVASTKTGGVCATQTAEQRVLYQADSVGNLANAFTPPFKIVTVAGSQAATVPMLDHLSQWLLAAALLGAFVLYDRARGVRIAVKGS